MKRIYLNLTEKTPLICGFEYWNRRIQIFDILSGSNNTDGCIFFKKISVGYFGNLERDLVKFFFLNEGSSPENQNPNVGKMTSILGDPRSFLNIVRSALLLLKEEGILSKLDLINLSEYRQQSLYYALLSDCTTYSWPFLIERTHKNLRNPTAPGCELLYDEDILTLTFLGNADAWVYKMTGRDSIRFFLKVLMEGALSSFDSFHLKVDFLREVFKAEENASSAYS